MQATTSSLVALRRRIARIEHHRPVRDSATVSFGHDGIDRILGGGLARGRLHEMFAGDAGDAGSAAGFTAMLATMLADDSPVVWLRPAEARDGRLHAPGLIELGLDPARLVLGTPGDPLDLLRAAAEVVRCPEVAVTVIELWRQPRPLDLTASRRLAVAAEASGVTVLMLRIAAEPAPSAAQTRWRVRSGRAAPLAANAPGFPTLDLELMRQRGGAEGMRWLVEWNRDQRSFSDATAPALSGAVFPPPGPGPAMAEPWRQAG